MTKKFNKVILKNKCICLNNLIISWFSTTRKNLSVAKQLLAVPFCFTSIYTESFTIDNSKDNPPATNFDSFVEKTASESAVNKGFDFFSDVNYESINLDSVGVSQEPILAFPLTLDISPVATNVAAAVQATGTTTILSAVVGGLLMLWSFSRVSFPARAGRGATAVAFRGLHRQQRFSSPQGRRSNLQRELLDRGFTVETKRKPKTLLRRLREAPRPFPGHPLTEGAFVYMDQARQMHEFLRPGIP